MAITVLLEAKAKPGTGNDFLEILKEILPDTRSHDGCKEITVYQNQDDADVMDLVGKWESKEKYTNISVGVRREAIWRFLPARWRVSQAFATST